MRGGSPGWALGGGRTFPRKMGRKPGVRVVRHGLDELRERRGEELRHVVSIKIGLHRLGRPRWRGGGLGSGLWAGLGTGLRRRRAGVHARPRLAGALVRRFPPALSGRRRRRRGAVRLRLVDAVVPVLGIQDGCASKPELHIRRRRVYCGRRIGYAAASVEGKGAVDAGRTIHGTHQFPSDPNGAEPLHGDGKVDGAGVREPHALHGLRVLGHGRGSRREELHGHYLQAALLTPCDDGAYLLSMQRTLVRARGRGSAGATPHLTPLYATLRGHDERAFAHPCSEAGRASAFAGCLATPRLRPATQRSGPGAAVAGP